MQLSLRHWPDMRLTWVSGCAMVHSGSEPGAGITALVTKASGAAELAVVVTSHTVRLLPPMMNELADLLADRLPPRCTRVRLVAWNSGCLHDDRPAPAYQLATRLGIEVIAPAGPLLGVPGGSLFAAAGRGAQRPGGWWRFAPGSAPSRVGWRYPAPLWDADLADLGDLGNGVVVDQVPAGLWLHRSGYRSMTDLVFSVPVDPDSPALVVSHPDEEPLRHDELAHALAVLPRRIVDRLVFTPYGPDPVTEGRLGEVAASLLGTPARTRPGLPLYGSGGQRALVTVDGDGRPLWQPFAREVLCNPRTESTETAEWINPAPEVLSEPIAPATFALGSGWAAEVIEAGLWIRPARSSEPNDWARNLPLNVEECTIVVGTPAGTYPPPPSALLATLLDRLPTDARARIRFAVPRGAGDDIVSLTAALSAQLPGTAEVRVLAPAGRRRARVTDEPAPALRDRTLPSRNPSAGLRNPAPALRNPAPALRNPAPAVNNPAAALREPTPYPGHPAYQPAPAPAHAATESIPAVDRPTPYPPQPVLRPTPYPGQPIVAPTPYPPQPIVAPTPYPPQPTVQPAPAHAATEGIPPVHRPTPYPPQATVQPRGPRSPAPHASQPLPFPPANRAAGGQGPRPAPLPPSALPPIPPAPISSAPISSAPIPPASHAARQPIPPMAPISPAPVSPAPIAPAPMSTAPISPAPVSPASFPVSSAPQPAAHQPGPPLAAPARAGQQRARGPRQAGAQPPGPVIHRTGLTPPMPPYAGSDTGSQPRAVHPMAAPPFAGSNTGPQPRAVHPMAAPPAPQAMPQPMPQPEYRPSPQSEYRPSPQPASGQPASATDQPALARKIDDSQDLMQRTEIRSHRTAAGKGSRGGRDDDKATASDASELNRLLGFFDEIRKARAWDEEPAGSRPGAS